MHLYVLHISLTNRSAIFSAKFDATHAARHVIALRYARYTYIRTHLHDIDGPALKAATRVAASTPPPKHLDICKGAPR